VIQPGIDKDGRDAMLWWGVEKDSSAAMQISQDHAAPLSLK